MISKLYRRLSNGLELGFYIETTGPLSLLELKKLQWLIAETFEPDWTRSESFMLPSDIVEIGPRLSIETPFSVRPKLKLHLL